MKYLLLILATSSVCYADGFAEGFARGFQQAYYGSSQQQNTETRSYWLAVNEYGRRSTYEMDTLSQCKQYVQNSGGFYVSCVLVEK